MKRYRREEYLLPLHLIEELCQIADLPLESLEIQGLMPDNWGAIKGGRKGIRTLSAKYEQQLNGGQREARLLEKGNLQFH